MPMRHWVRAQPRHRHSPGITRRLQPVTAGAGEEGEERVGLGGVCSNLMVIIITILEGLPSLCLEDPP